MEVAYRQTDRHRQTPCVSRFRSNFVYSMFAPLTGLCWAQKATRVCRQWQARQGLLWPKYAFGLLRCLFETNQHNLSVNGAWSEHLHRQWRHQHRRPITATTQKAHGEAHTSTGKPGPAWKIGTHSKGPGVRSCCACLRQLSCTAPVCQLPKVQKESCDRQCTARDRCSA